MNLSGRYEKKQCHAWKQEGLVSLWRYEPRNRNFDGWHITADKTGCASLIDLLDALSMDGPGATRSVGISTPTKAMIAVPNCPVRTFVAPSALRITIAKDPTEWRFPVASEYAQLSMGMGWLPLMRQGIKDIVDGDGDYSIGSSGKDDLPLWFWW
jgi:hypothetical protein